MTIFGKSGTTSIWLHDGLIPGISAFIEALWAYPWIAFLLASGEESGAQRFPFPWILGLILLPALLGRWLECSYSLPRQVRQHGLFVLVVALFVAFLVPYHGAGAAWLVAAALLARGVWLALGEITSESAAGWFMAGLGAFLVLLVLLPPSHPWLEQSVLVAGLAGYLFAGIAWLALVRQQELEERAFRGAAHQINGAWLAMFSAIAALTVGLPAVVSSAGAAILWAIEGVVLAVAQAIWQAAMAVVMWLVPLLLRLLSLLPAGGSAARRGVSRSAGQGRPNLPSPTIHLHVPIQLLLALVFGLLLALLGVWLAQRFRPRPASELEDEERTSLWSWRLFWHQLRQALASVRLARRALPERTPALSAVQSTPAGSSVRQLYAAVLRWCSRHGRSREPSETPLEFEPELRQELNASLSEDLTATYVAVRYGEMDPGSDRIEDLVQRWRRWEAEHTDEPG